MLRAYLEDVSQYMEFVVGEGRSAWKCSICVKFYVSRSAMEVIIVFMFNGSSLHYAYIWSKSKISISWRHLPTSKELSNPVFFVVGKYLLYIIRAHHVLSYHLILVPWMYLPRVRRTNIFSEICITTLETACCRLHSAADQSKSYLVITQILSY